MEDWKKQLEDLFKTKQQQEEEQKQKRKEGDAATKARKEEAISFITQTVIAAFTELKAEFEKHEMTVSVEQGDVSALMTIRSGQVRQMLTGERKEFQYSIYISFGPTSATPIVACSSMDRHNITRNNQPLEITNIDKEDIIKDFMKAYKKQEGKLGTATY